MERATDLRAKYQQAGQGHVFTFFDQLQPTEKDELITQLSTIDPHRVNQIFKQSTSSPDSDSGQEKIVFEPPPSDSLESTIDVSNSEVTKNVAQWQSLGLKSIEDQKVAILLLAGGQGTRLGSSDPKGCYNIALPSQKSLFQLQAEKIIRLQHLVGRSSIIPWSAYLHSSLLWVKCRTDYLFFFFSFFS